MLSSHRPVAGTRGIGSTRRAVLIHCFRPAREDNLTPRAMVLSQMKSTGF
ncbi:hypothetical protein fugu_002621 [Takifugu bimaculatus]|uniref:Uncharacterized protein n=1 Tax=Takifugu bimaculatus TaxID=433685 RepID=A0A4Z2BE95_9TELE|nr:hypothetical protein fugu_002621 [Takifugu bimaculatus]